MFDNYIAKIEKNSSFLAGYNLSLQKGDNHPVFLFTSLRIIRVISGKCEWKIGKKTHLIKEKDIVVVNNMEPRQFLRTFNTDVTCDVFAFSPIAFNSTVECFALFFNQAKDFNPVITQYNIDSGTIHQLLDILKNMITGQQHTPLLAETVSGIITSVCSYILHTLSINTPFNLKAQTSASASELVMGAIEYIYNNSSGDISVSLLAKNASVTREYFTRIFKKYTGVTPTDFITRCKINNVLKLITTKNINILDAAMESGFNTSSGFYRAFNSLYKMSPKKFLSQSK